MARSASIAFQGFPRILDRADLRAGRWFVAAEDIRPVLCFVTEAVEGDDPIALTFSTARVEQVDFAAIALSRIPAPYCTVEDEIVFTPGLAAPGPLLLAPVRRPFRSGTLLRLRNGDLGVGFALRSGELVLVSLDSGAVSEAYDLVFERWTLSVRRDAVTHVIGHFKPLATLAAERRRGGAAASAEG
ncbi:hypothetical protein ACO2Q3_23890 [Caulobacter sp. KR2-114]|uniref:hypothetical protein n=1 Tax=Caulobacter sp. KR2-114 TaxID=3400912 RepID=UPI003C012CBF